MRPKTIIGPLIALSTIFHSRQCAQQFETRDKIRLEIEIAMKTSSDARKRYSYSISSSNQSTQKTWCYYVISRVPPDNIQNVVSPALWKFGLPENTSTAQVRWTSVGGEILPGSNLSGFGFESVGVPGIVDYYAEGYAPPPAWDGSVEEDTIRGYHDLTPYGPGIVGKTVGPALPPTPFVHLAFLDTILLYVRQSAELAWLGHDGDRDCDDDERPEDGIAGNLEKRLLKARGELEQGDSIRARKELEKFVKKVDRIWKRAEQEEKLRGKKKDKDWRIMTDEAYALLKFNAEYLIGQLPEREKPRGRK